MTGTIKKVKSNQIRSVQEKHQTKNFKVFCEKKEKKEGAKRELPCLEHLIEERLKKCEAID